MNKYEKRKVDLYRLLMEDCHVHTEYLISYNDALYDDYLREAIEMETYEEYKYVYNMTVAEMDVIEINYVAYNNIKDEKLKEFCLRNIDDSIKIINEQLVRYGYIKFDKDTMTVRNYTEQEKKDYKRKIKEEAERLERLKNEVLENDEIPF